MPSAARCARQRQHETTEQPSTEASAPLTSPLLPSAAPEGGGGEAPRPLVAPLAPASEPLPQPSPFWLPPEAGSEALQLTGPSAGSIHCAFAAMVGREQEQADAGLQGRT